MALAHTLEVFRGDERIFVSDGHWLHPLIELEGYLTKSEVAPGDLTLRDKVVGRAAALLMVRMGIGRVHARLLSELGKDILESYAVPYSYDELVPRISCRTETLLHDETDPEAAYTLIRTLMSN
jgi:zinc transport system ATP-binding protein